MSLGLRVWEFIGFTSNIHFVDYIGVEREQIILEGSGDLVTRLYKWGNKSPNWGWPAYLAVYNRLYRET